MAIAAGRARLQDSGGIRVHGGWGRSGIKQSFRLYFREEYGTRELAYPLFGAAAGQTYDRLVLRAGEQRQLVAGWG